ncbi:MAG TPA: dipeptide/oligopeptide/nickel ABC transporter permease/ATP-binding protein [Homoserinimonas sp.]|nr:dipeptide/oligopeptide/nickel ABC transporter permease/ATP-binding protein [Homoserinimonas sp.]
MSEAIVASEGVLGPVESGREGIFRRLVRKPTAVFAMVVLLGIVVLAFIGPLIAPFGAGLTTLQQINAPPFSSEYLLGGDRAGRDILSRLLWGTGNTIGGSALAVVVSAVLGIAGGLVAGYYGKLVDTIGNWLSNLLLAVPGIIVLIAFFVVVGPSTAASMTVVGVLLSPSFFRLVRNLVIAVKHELYVDAARVSGLSDLRIIAKHILVIVRAPIIIQMAFAAGVAIIIQAGLEFIGLGSPETPTWGGMLQDSFSALYIAPLSIAWPSAAIFLTVLALVLLSNAVRDILESRSSAGRRFSGVVVEEYPPPSDAPSDALLTVENLTIAYPLSSDDARKVVSGVSLWVRRGEVLGLVGESGSGKTQTAFAILGLLPPEAIVASGRVELAGRSLLGLSEARLNAIRGSEIAYVPQEPLSNLDPAFTIGQQLDFAMRRKLGLTRQQTRSRSLDLLDRVGMIDPHKVFDSYPHQLSGGMAQRVLIAMAVSCDPELLIADEPTTALDVTVQAEVLDLLRDLQRERSMGMILVTHNFGVVADICDRVSVMREGRIVETNATQDLFDHPEHPYTRMLLGSVLDNAPTRPPLNRPGGTR